MELRIDPERGQNLYVTLVGVHDLSGSLVGTVEWSTEHIQDGRRPTFNKAKGVELSESQKLEVEQLLILARAVYAEPTKVTR
jgi:hypothetical protein